LGKTLGVMPPIFRFVRNVYPLSADFLRIALNDRSRERCLAASKDVDLPQKARCVAGAITVCKFAPPVSPAKQPPVKDATLNFRCGGFLRMHCCGQHLLSPYPPRTFELKHDRLIGAHGSTLTPLF